MRRIGVDTGGTFTDCVLLDDESGQFTVAKVPSQPTNPAAAIINGIRSVLAASGFGPGDIDSVVHGTTIATNAVITEDMARIGMITTQGCRDVVEIGTQRRPLLYYLNQKQSLCVAPRELRIEVPGRIAYDGSEIEPLGADQVRDAVARLAEAEVQAIAVCGLFSIANGKHEQAIREICNEAMPGTYVACSADISPEVREYPRFITTAINAALEPLLVPYLENLERALTAENFHCALYIMKSNGGVATTTRSMGENAHHLVLSGPAGGVVGGIHASASIGYTNLVTLDIGGTSADIGIVIDGKPRTRTEMGLPNGVPLFLSNLEIETIGAGGGSIAWADEGGALHVGPHSAGADPGPACYETGGTEATLTDAQVVLGRLNPEGILGGRMKLSHEAAARAVEGLGRKLALEIEDTAKGIVAVAEANMAGAIRQTAARNGDDLREFALLAAGGAGPLNGASLMRMLGMRAVVVTPYPGLLSAGGLLNSSLRHDLARPVLTWGEDPDAALIERTQEELEALAEKLLDEDGIAPERRRCAFQLDLRYIGQEYTVSVACRRNEELEAIVDRFHEEHEKAYGHSARGEPTEIVMARATAWGDFERIRLADLDAGRKPQAVGEREVWFEEALGYVTTAIYHREALAREARIAGPAVVEQLDTTIVIPPGAAANVERSGILVIREESGHD
ncbi:MAG: hydantoinase/oxoprolinase family protein [Gammaproteobacteria bacterium]|nr:hydantoinase/oxoprolinase family protein [Gammaproteobacteria bacterium]